MQGLHAELRRHFTRSVRNYIVAARMQQGQDDLESSTPGERQDILARWGARRGDLRGFYLLKQKERKSGGGDGDDDSSLVYSVDDNEELERAIYESVRQTSRGDPDEDARIEQVIRDSVVEMHRIAESSREEGYDKGDAELGGGAGPLLAPRLPAHDDHITDEEYQELIAKAVEQSLAERAHSPGREGDDEFHRALEESRAYRQQHPEGNDNDEEQMRRVIEESERAHRERMERDRAEEATVMEYVKRQSLAEDEFRRQAAKGKAKATADHDDDDDDEDLKRALEESLRTSNAGKYGEPSGSSSHAELEG